MMKFKNGDRVHVTRFENENVDFYGSLSDAGISLNVWEVVNCSDCQYEGVVIYRENDEDFGEHKDDYYTLVTDEEDTEKPEIQYISDMYNEPCNRLERRTNNVELDDEYIIEVKKDTYVQLITHNDYFRFTKNISLADVYEYKSDAIEHAELIDGRVLNLKRYVEVE